MNTYGGEYGRFWFHDAEPTEDMTRPVRCRCGRIYDLGKVTVTGRWLDCSTWTTPCCKVTADDRKPPWGISWYEELPQQRRPVYDDEESE